MGGGRFLFPQGTGTVQLQVMPEEIASSPDAFRITAFEIDAENETLGFGVAWTNTLFDYTASRDIHLFSSTNLQEQRWSPLGTFAMPWGETSCVFAVTADDVDASVRQRFLDTFAGRGFYTFGIDFDSDGDGLSDAHELLWTLTDPSNPDTDGDGLGDGEELAVGTNTNPLLYDTDGDGVGDGDEVIAGTDPRSGDTDGDGLTDAQELGTMSALAEDDFMWFDMSGGTDLLSGYSTQDSGTWMIPISSRITVNGVCYTNARVCVDGTAYLLCPTNRAGSDYIGYSDELRDTRWSACHMTVAVCASDLYARTSEWGSRILYGNVASGGRTFDVVEYRDMGHWDYLGTGDRITCQMILPHDETNVVYVSYLCASNAFRTVSLAAGIQCGWMRSWRPGERFYNLSWPAGPDFPQDGLTIRYCIGTGTDPACSDTDFDVISDADEVLACRTDPLAPDTDGDGLPDGGELSAGTDPLDSDTDGDGMPDGWEAAYGLDPLADDSADDPDGDGISNMQEHSACTSPVSVDTDGDGLSDPQEIAAGTNPTIPDTDGDRLTDGEEQGLGTNPLVADTDGDGLWDGWEADGGLDPLCASGGDGADGDPDGDSLSNAKERKFGTSPSVADTDGDGLPDGLETGGVFVTNAVPWLQFDECEDVTAAIAADYRRCARRPLPEPLRIQGELVTNMTLSANGIIFLDRAGYANPGNMASSSGFSQAIDANALVIAPYLDYLYVRDDIAGRETAIRIGTATRGGEGCLLVEYGNAYTDVSVRQTNSVSFQVSIPTNAPDRAYVAYRDVAGNATGGGACIGMQTFGGRWLHPYCLYAAGKVWDGLAIAFLFGGNSDPLDPDTDGDGIPDGQEALYGTSPAKQDTDDDGMRDCWEIEHGMDPLSAAGDDGAAGDRDGDGVDNLGECGLGTDPNAADTDGDGLSDGEEAVCVSLSSPMPWLEVATLTNMTAALEDSWGRASICLPWPVTLQSTFVTNITVDINGVVYFNRAGYENPENYIGACDLECDVVDTNCFTVAPFWGWKFLSDEAAPSSVRFGTATVGGGVCYVLECVNLYQDLDWWETNSISFQVTFPTGRVDRICVRYADVTGDGMDGRDASIGFQSFDARERVSYCYEREGMVREGLGLAFVVGCGSDPTKADTDGDGLDDNAEVSVHGSDPRLADTDGDGLSDAQEIARGTAADNPDTDGDGLLDGWEAACGLNPLSATGDDGGGADPDGDGLTNLQEQSHGGAPLAADTDGDGLPDATEVLLGTGISLADTDRDGLSDGVEHSVGTDPFQPDSDSDGMDDGWEHRYRAAGFDPLAHNAADADPDNDIGADPDGDGLTNGQECELRTNPVAADTDGDGVDDGTESGQGSDPGDASDGGQPGARLPVRFCFGDPSESLSEKYRLEITPVSGDGAAPMPFSWLNANYGQCETRTAYLKPGWKYEVRMQWASCAHPSDGREYPNYDYTLRCEADLLPDGVLVDDPDGLFKERYYGSAYYGKPYFPELDKVAYVYVLASPRLTPDYDRDGEIGPSDEAICDARQTTFRFWTNNDNDTGNVNESRNDRPGSGANGQDGRVNGRGDLLDFTPVLLDVSRVFPPGTPTSIMERVSWKLQSSAVNAVWTSLSASDAGSFHRTEDAGATFGPNLSQYAREATVTALPAGAPLPDGFLQAMRNAGGKGVVMIEGRARGSSLRLQGFIDESPTPAFEGTLEIEVSPVEDMYRWLCMRNVCGDSSGLGSRLDVPSNRPDAECDGQHFIFVHGYSVDVQSARGWAAEMFKRLWQSGSQSMFTAVDWFGNDSQIWGGVPVIGGESLDYYVNVRHALDTALNFSIAANALPGSKVMLAHSLGNMLVSEAAKYHLLDYQKYYMLNAAVPMEAYDADASAQEMIEHGWSDVDPSKWAANWYEHIPYSGDPRQTLKWRGRFAGIHDAINCYSPTEDILANATINGWGGLWGAQELFKGTATLHFIPGNCEGGWGYNSEHTNLAGWLTDFAKTNEFTDAELIASPIFRRFDNALLHQTNIISIAQTELNKVMGDGIPARSFAAGRNPIGSTISEDYNYQGSPRPNGWPRRENEWLHSDITKVAYFYVYDFFDKLTK